MVGESTVNRKPLATPEKVRIPVWWRDLNKGKPNSIIRDFLKISESGVDHFRYVQPLAKAWMHTGMVTGSTRRRRRVAARIK